MHTAERNYEMACERKWQREEDAADELAEQIAEMATDYAVAGWTKLSESPEAALDYFEDWNPDPIQILGRVAHFAAFMRQHGPLDGAALAAIGARVIAEVEAVIDEAAQFQAEGRLL